MNPPDTWLLSETTRGASWWDLGRSAGKRNAGLASLCPELAEVSGAHVSAPGEEDSHWVTLETRTTVNSTLYTPSFLNSVLQFGFGHNLKED